MRSIWNALVHSFCVREMQSPRDKVICVFGKRQPLYAGALHADWSHSWNWSKRCKLKTTNFAKAYLLPKFRQNRLTITEVTKRGNLIIISQVQSRKLVLRTVIGFENRFIRKPIRRKCIQKPVLSHDQTYFLKVELASSDYYNAFLRNNPQTVPSVDGSGGTRMQGLPLAVSNFMFLMVTRFCN